MTQWRALWAELMRPAGKGQSPAARLGTAAGHAVLGAAAASLLSLAMSPAISLALVVVGYSAKELRDLWSGGGWRDGAIDTAFVALGGVAAPWPVMWPLVLGAAVMDGVKGDVWR